MRNLLPALALSLLSAWIFHVQADELLIGTDPSAEFSRSGLPAKGQTSGSVLKTYGQPQLKHAPVGGDAPKHPPITRWDYANFSVFFEHNHVVDAVVPGHPAQVFHTETLKPATASY